MANLNQYYIALDETVFGPYSLNEILKLGLLPNTMVSRTDTDWAMASQYPELQHLFQNNNQSPSRIRQTTPVFDHQRLVYKQKRKAALIGVLTLGLAGLTIIGIGETWRNNIFAGTSFDHGGLGFVMKIISFMLLSVLVAIPFFIISLIQFIYYSIKLSDE